MRFGATARVELGFGIKGLADTNVPTYVDNVEIALDIECTVIVSAALKATDESKGAMFMDLRDVRDFTLRINDSELDSQVLEFLEALLERVIRVNLEAQKEIPLTFLIDLEQRAGVPIYEVASRIRGPEREQSGTLSIGIDTYNSGDPEKIGHIVPHGSGFGCVISRGFFLEQAWPRVRSRFFPHWVDRRTKIWRPKMDLRDGHVWFYVEARRRMDCLPDVDATAKVKLVFRAFRGPNGEWRTRLVAPGKPDVEVDFWDRLFYTFVVGLLGSTLGLGMIGMIVLNVLIAIFEDKTETNIANKLQEASVGFRERIPGTNIVAAASTPIAPTITRRRIFAHGDVVFVEED